MSPLATADPLLQVPQSAALNPLEEVMAMSVAIVDARERKRSGIARGVSHPLTPRRRAGSREPTTIHRAIDQITAASITVHGLQRKLDRGNAIAPSELMLYLRMLDQQVRAIGALLIDLRDQSDGTTR